MDVDLNISSSELRIDFSCSKTSNYTFNVGELLIYNLSLQNRNNITNLLGKVIVSAGYEENQGLKTIFIGDILRVSHRKVDTDIVSSIYLGDGAEVLRGTVASRTFAVRGNVITDARTIISETAEEFGLPVNFVATLPAGSLMPGSYALSGLVASDLQFLCKRFGLEWSIQDETVLIINENSVLNAPAVLCSTNTGLLSDPNAKDKVNTDFTTEPDRERYTVEMLLTPEIGIASQVEIRSNVIQGIYRASDVEHSVSNYSSSFYTKFVAEEITNGS